MRGTDEGNPRRFYASTNEPRYTEQGTRRMGNGCDDGWVRWSSRSRVWKIERLPLFP